MTNPPTEAPAHDMSIIIIIIVFMASFMLLWTGLVKLLEKRRDAKALVLAGQHGYEVDVARTKPPDLGFDELSTGFFRKMSERFSRPGQQDSVFYYQCQGSGITLNGAGGYSIRRTCALMALPFTAPHVRITERDVWPTTMKRVNRPDFQVHGAPAFNQQYRVETDDEHFAALLLDSPMVEWLLVHQDDFSNVSFEVSGNWLLCTTISIHSEKMFGFLEWAQELRDRMPNELARLHPLA